MKLDLRSGDAFWRLRDGLVQSYPALPGDTEADVVIVGGGISGACAAYALSDLGLGVVVLDRRDVAAGSSAASTGLLLYETDSSLEDLERSVGAAGATRVYRLGLDAIDEIARVCGGGCGFERRPSVYLASRRRDVAALRRECERRLASGFDVEWLDRRRLRQDYSFRAAAAIRAHGTASVDPYALTHRLLQLASARGVAIFDRTDASWPVRTGDWWTVSTNRGGSVRARRVIWAAGYEAHGHAGPQAYPLQSTWALVTEPLTGWAGWPDRCLIWETARPYVYVRATDDGRLMIGGEDDACAECHRGERAMHRKARRLLRRAQRLFPELALEPAYIWAGTFATTSDGLPFIGERDQPGLWLTLGYGGNGITFSAIAARLLRDHVRGIANPDARLFGFDRSPAVM